VEFIRRDLDGSHEQGLQLMWDAIIPMLGGGGGGAFDVTLDADYLAQFNLFTYMGEPPGVVQASVLITNGARVGSLVIAGFAVGSTFAITLTGGGTLVGKGGAGGKGGFGEYDPIIDLWGPGFPGKTGGAALKTDYNIYLNADDGYLYGGGGGGGGGGGAENEGGSGGGGGRGWNNAFGGYGEYFQGQDGYAGSIDAPGEGGRANAWGGDGGSWGTAGGNGNTGTPNGSLGGAGGAAGNAVYLNNSGLVVTLNGIKTQATLVAEFRLQGGVFLNGGSVVDP
jgi:hypothetical protein